MGWFNRKKKRVKYIVVRLEDADSRKDGLQYKIDLDVGQSFSIDRITGDLSIMDSDGDIVKLYDWQAGYTVSYDIKREEVDG